MVLPIALLLFKSLDLLKLMLQIPSLALAFHGLLLVDKFEYSAKKRLDKQLLYELCLFFSSFLFL